MSRLPPPSGVLHGVCYLSVGSLPYHPRLSDPSWTLSSTHATAIAPKKFLKFIVFTVTGKFEDVNVMTGLNNEPCKVIGHELFDSREIRSFR